MQPESSRLRHCVGPAAPRHPRRAEAAPTQTTKFFTNNVPLDPHSHAGRRGGSPQLDQRVHPRSERGREVIIGVTAAMVVSPDKRATGTRAPLAVTGDGPLRARLYYNQS